MELMYVQEGHLWISVIKLASGSAAGAVHTLRWANGHSHLQASPFRCRREEFVKAVLWSQACAVERPGVIWVV